MIVFVAGAPGTGKTTICKEKSSVFSFDEWLLETYGHADVERCGFDWINDPKGMDRYLDAVASAYFSSHDDLWLDDGAVDRDRRMAVVSGLARRGVRDMRCVYVLCPLYDAAGRNAARKRPIPRELFYDSWARQEFPTTDEGFFSVEFVVSGDR